MLNSLTHLTKKEWESGYVRLGLKHKICQRKMSVICLLQTKHGSILTNSGYNLLETPAAFQGEEVAMGQAISSSFSCCSDSHTESSESEAAARTQNYQQQTGSRLSLGSCQLSATYNNSPSLFYAFDELKEWKPNKNSVGFKVTNRFGRITQ